MGTAAHKNLHGVISAVEKISCALIIIGKIDDALTYMLDKKDIDFENYVSIDKQKLESLYLEVDLVTFPSFHEGFGLPIIEAQSFSIPIITSNISPMKEVAGDGAIFVNPADINDIQKAIKKVLSDGEFVETLVEQGKQNAALYSDKIVADQRLEQYRKLVST